MDSRTKNRKTRAQIERLVGRCFGGLGLAAGDDAVRELEEGWFNVAYDLTLADGRATILKIAPPPDAEVMTYERSLMATEVSAMRLVRADPRIPVPELYGFDPRGDLCDADYFFMAKLAGDNLVHVRDRLPPATDAAIQFEIGRIVRAINAFPGTYFGYPGNPELRGGDWPTAFLRIMEAAFADGRRKAVDYGYREAELRAALARHAPALAAVTAPCLVHWDAWDSNVLVADGRITGIIDFERALWGDPLMEPQFRPFFGAGATDSRRGYGKTEFTFAEWQRCHLYTLHLAVVMHTECFYRHYATDEIYRYSQSLLASTMEWLTAN